MQANSEIVQHRRDVTNRPRGVLPSRRLALDALFAPKSVALIGATDAAGSVGRALMENLRALDGAVYPVNPRRERVLGVKTFPSIAAVPEPVDLAVIATPAATVPRIVGECAEAGVRSAVIISAGFKECGAEGAALEREILARRGAGRRARHAQRRGHSDLRLSRRSRAPSR